MHVLLLYNEPTLPPDHPDAASEAGVLEAVEAVEAALTEGRHQVRRLGVGNSIANLLDDLHKLDAPDVVFNLCEGLRGVGEGESHVAGLIELLGWPLTGSSPECLALARDKARMKWLLKGAGLPTPEFNYIAADETMSEDVLDEPLSQGPLIVKPAGEDASLGIGPDSVVTDMAALRRQVASVQQRYGAVLVERYIAGREFNAGVVAIPEAQLLPLAEIEFSESSALDRVVSYEAKWVAGSAADLGTQVRCPATVDPHLGASIGRVALAAFRLAGCRDYARIDLRLDDQRRPWILEVNANPDLSPSAGLARAVKVSGLSYADFVNRMVEHAQATRRREK